MQHHRAVGDHVVPLAARVLRCLPPAQGRCSGLVQALAQAGAGNCGSLNHLAATLAAAISFRSRLCTRAALFPHLGEALPEKKWGPRWRTPGASTRTADLPFA